MMEKREKATVQQATHDGNVESENLRMFRRYSVLERQGGIPFSKNFLKSSK